MRLQGHHLALFFLAYVTTVDRDLAYVRKGFESYVPGVFRGYNNAIGIALLAAAISLPNAEQTVLIWALLCGYKGLKAIVSGPELAQLHSYATSLVAVLALVGVYNGWLPRQRLPYVYAGMAAAYALLVASDITTPSKVVEDVTLAHLLFFVTK